MKTAIVLPIVVVFIATMSVQLVMQRSALEQVVGGESSQILRHMVSTVRARMDSFLAAPRAAHSALSMAVRRGPAPVGDVTALPEVLRTLLMDTFRGDLQINQISFVSGSGDYVGVRRNDRSSDGAEVLLHDHAVHERTGGVSAPPGPQAVSAEPYDPRRMPWFTAAVAGQKTLWSEVYVTADERAELAIAIAAPVSSRRGFLGVAAAELTLMGLSRHLRVMSEQSGGFLALVDRQGRLVAHSHLSEVSRIHPRTREIERLKLSDSADALELALAPVVAASMSTTGAAFELAFGAEHYFGRIEPYSPGEGLDWRIVALMPEAVLLGDMRKTYVTSGIVAALMVVAGIIATIWVISLVTRPLLTAAHAARQASLRDLSDLRNEATPVRETALLMGAISDMAVQLQGSIERLRSMALLDEPTGLATRRGLIDAIAWTEPRHCALFAIGIDDFRSINSIFGYETGDEVLRGVAARLRACVPAPLLVARTGGDEFSVLFLIDESSPPWSALANHLLAIFDTAIEVQRERLSVRGSVGVMTGGLSQDNILEWLRCVGFALREAKVSRVQACVPYSSELQRETVRHGQFVSDLRRAAEGNEFVVLYQPIVDMRSGRIEGAEALVRWQHPELGLLPPSMFVHIAEESDIIIKMGEQVLRQVCDCALRHHEQTGRWLNLHVNVSSRQLLQHDYHGLVHQTLAQAGMPAHCLTLELTESMFIGHDDARVSSIFLSLKAVGVEIAVDDFGTGYSSLAYLERLPLDCLKIDRSFVLKLFDPDSRGYAVAAAVIGVGQRLGFKLVGEGVETPAQARQLLDLGCHLAQGYLFAKPSRWEDIDFEASYLP